MSKITIVRSVVFMLWVQRGRKPDFLQVKSAVGEELTKRSYNIACKAIMEDVTLSKCLPTLRISSRIEPELEIKQLFARVLKLAWSGPVVGYREFARYINALSERDRKTFLAYVENWETTRKSVRWKSMQEAVGESPKAKKKAKKEQPYDPF